MYIVIVKFFYFDSTDLNFFKEYEKAKYFFNALKKLDYSDLEYCIFTKVLEDE